MAKKVEIGTLYLAGKPAAALPVRPEDGVVFTLGELRQAVGGYVELVVPAQRYATVYVNEEAVLQNLPRNESTWAFARKKTYLLNGYGEAWRVQGNALEVRKVLPSEVRACFTVKEALRGDN